MTSDPDTSTPAPAPTSARSHPAAGAGIAPGRPIVLTPTPPGLWSIIGGAVIAALGPLFGFLVGTMIGSTTDADDLDPIYLSLFAGLVVGGLGVALLLIGVRRMLRDRRM